MSSTEPGRDADPGDGVCETEPGNGTCTLPAAIDEGNALGRASLTVPAGSYSAGEVTITGLLSINQRAPAEIFIGGRFTVTAGAALILNGANADQSVMPLTFRVDGALAARNVKFTSGAPPASVVHVGPTGTALLENSLIGASFAPESVVVNEGRLFLRHAWLVNIVPDPPAYALETVGAGISSLAASIVAGIALPPAFPFIPYANCGGTAPISQGYNAEGDQSCSLSGPNDVSNIGSIDSMPSDRFSDYVLGPNSPLTDAIPLGVHGCGTHPGGDWYQQPRPADGNADGVLACDIGPKERQP